MFRLSAETIPETADLFVNLRAPLLRYTMALGLAVHDAEDVAQEVFLSLCRHLHLGRPSQNLQGWIFRTGHNLALKRRMRVQREAVPQDADLSLKAEPDTALNPEQQLSAKQRRQRLEAVLNALPQRDQQCLKLRAEGVPYREIAARLNMSLGAVAASISRSLDRISSVDQR